MRRTALSGVAFVALLAVSIVVSPEWARIEAGTTPPPQPTTAPPVVAPQPPSDVSYCDRTASVVSPYTLVTAAADLIVQQGHGSHTGPVFPAVGADGRWGDVIPPFDYDNGQQHFPGLNWPAGSAVLDAGCAVHETVNLATRRTDDLGDQTEHQCQRLVPRSDEPRCHVQ